MNTNFKVVKPVTGNSNLVRPRFSPGLLLRDDDLKQGVDYTRDLSRLLFRTLFGCGVVCGLVVKWSFNCNKLFLTVGDGVALDCHGDPIHVPEPQPIQIDPSCGDEIPKEMWIVLKRTEKCCAPRIAACSCDDDETPAVCTRERDGYEIRVLPHLPECTCGCCKEATTTTTETKTDPAAAKAKSAKKGQGTQNASSGDQTAAYSATSDAGQAGKTAEECWCVDPKLPCYSDHYAGKCGCECCDCEWIVLAYVKETFEDKNNRKWKVDHSVRRFIRPILMRDPEAWREAHPTST